MKNHKSMLSIVCFFCLTFGLILSTAVSATAEDWHQFRGPNRDGQSHEKNCWSSWPPKEVWRFKAGVGYTSVSIANGKAYVMGNFERAGTRGVDVVHCLDAATGQPVWTHKYECMTSKSDDQAAYSGPRSTPVIDEDRVYTVSLEGQVFCLDANTGKVRWNQQLNKYAFGDLSGLIYGYCTTPLVYENKVFIMVNGALVAFDKLNGKVIWRCKGGRPLWNGSSPVIGKFNDKTCVVFGESELIGANVETGDIVFQHNLGRTTINTPIISGNKVFYSVFPNRGACGVFEVLANGETKSVWANREIMNYHTGNPVLHNGYLYGSDNARTEYLLTDEKVSSFKCLDFNTGKKMWEAKGMGIADVLFSDGKLVIQRESGELVLADAKPDSYKEIGRWSLPKNVFWAFPALSDGRLYCRDNDGNVYCLKVGKCSKDAEKKDDASKPAADGADKQNAPADGDGANADAGLNNTVAKADEPASDGAVVKEQTVVSAGLSQ